MKFLEADLGIDIFASTVAYDFLGTPSGFVYDVYLEGSGLWFSATNTGPGPDPVTIPAPGAMLLGGIGTSSSAAENDEDGDSSFRLTEPANRRRVAPFPRPRARQSDLSMLEISPEAPSLEFIPTQCPRPIARPPKRRCVPLGVNSLTQPRRVRPYCERGDQARLRRVTSGPRR